MPRRTRQRSSKYSQFRKRPRMEMHQAFIRADTGSVDLLSRRLPSMPATQLVELMNLYAERKKTAGHDLTPLLFSVKQSETELALCLLREGANPNAGQISGMSPLGVACIQQKQDICRALIKAGADVLHMDQNGNTPMYYCMNPTTSVPIVKELLEAGFPMEGIISNKPGEVFTPLIEAVNLGNMVVIDFLLNEGADVNGTSEGVSPLSMAAFVRSREITELLLKRGGLLTFGKSNRSIIHPLNIAAENGDLDILDLLTEHYKKDSERGTWRAMDENYQIHMENLFQKAMGLAIKKGHDKAYKKILMSWAHLVVPKNYANGNPFPLEAFF